MDPPRASRDDIVMRHRCRQCGDRSGIRAASRGQEHSDPVIMPMVVGSLGRSVMVRFPLARISCRMVMRRRFVVPLQVRMEDRMRYGPYGVGKGYEQQSNRGSAERGTHRQAEYPFSRRHALV